MRKVEVKQNRILFYYNSTVIPSHKIIFKDEESHLVQEFIEFYLKLTSNKRKELREKAKNFSLDKFLYYVKVWYYTGESLQDNPLVKDNKEHIDHIIPIIEGFNRKIAPKFIGSSFNLQVLTIKENFQKSNKLTDKALYLLEKWENQTEC